MNQTFTMNGVPMEMRIDSGDYYPINDKCDKDKNETCLYADSVVYYASVPMNDYLQIDIRAGNTSVAYMQGFTKTSFEYSNEELGCQDIKNRKLYVCL